jgi:hypothetical protein
VDVVLDSPMTLVVRLRPVECQSNLVIYFDSCEVLVQLLRIKAYSDALGYKTFASLKTSCPREFFP